MSNLDEYLAKRGVTPAQMEQAERETQTLVEAYNLREARKTSHMTQVQVAKQLDMTQVQVSRMEKKILGKLRERL